MLQCLVSEFQTVEVIFQRSTALQVPGGLGNPGVPRSWESRGSWKSQGWVPLLYHAEFEVNVKSNRITYRNYKNL